MCGIFGILGDVDKPLIMRMSEVLRHRGPDDKGFFFDNKVALGNTRLSIIDTEGGHQPIHNEESTIWITYNGEIYNFRELRQTLVKLGHKFYTNSDTEVIVHAYEEWGENCVQKFNGMWAFAIWDSIKKQLFLSRDRFGIKPLYYFTNGQRFVFASEIKAILLDRNVPKTPNDKVIYDYLVYGLVDHTEQTFFDRVKRLLPAHNLLISDNGVRIQKYWDLPRTREHIEDSDKNDSFYAGRFLELFRNSVELQLAGEVPLGTCLSGGLDSSSIVCVLNRLLRHDPQAIKVIGERQKTFTVRFEDAQLDETRYAEEVIRETGAEENFTFPSPRKLWKEINRFVYSQEEPCVSSSVYAQRCVAELASKKVKVILDGQGGDELLVGYLGYHLVLLQDLLRKRKLKSFFIELFSSLDILVPHVRHYLFSSPSKLSKEVKSLLDNQFISEFDSVTETPALIQYDDLLDLLRKQMTQTNLPALLRYEDKNSMAFSVEARVPFLDHQLVEYGFSLPVAQKLKNGWTKRVLRNSMRGVVPEKVLRRRDKIAFATPQATWLKELRGEIEEIFTSCEFLGRKYFRRF
jgi:asparagine synthase (glutamine-hydrolysing)